MAHNLVVRLHWMWNKGSNYQQAAEFHLHQSIEKLKQKWAAFAWEIVDVIVREEMKISGEEFDEEIETRTQ